MPQAFDQTGFAATTMDAMSQDDGVASYGYLGRYRLDRMIGHGAMGAVFEAFDSTLGRTIAIKTLYTPLGQAESGFDTAMVDAAILQEARAAATLNHPNIVTVYDAGRAVSSMLGRELPYVAMELLQGIDLRQRINDGPPLAQREAVALIGKLALALDHAHKAGVMHRDIKPANVFMSKTNGLKILDFGLAKFTEQAKLSAQQSNAPSSALVAGSPQYMSPEMVLSVSDSSVVVDLRSDVYSLGVMLYELLCQRQPYQAATLELLQQIIVKKTPAAPHLVNPDIPRELSDMVLNALEKKPQDRYRSAAQFARDLRRWGTTTVDAETEPANLAAQQPVKAAGLGSSQPYKSKPSTAPAAAKEPQDAAVQAAGTDSAAMGLLPSVLPSPANLASDGAAGVSAPPDWASTTTATEPAGHSRRAPMLMAGAAAAVAITAALWLWQSSRPAADTAGVLTASKNTPPAASPATPSFTPPEGAAPRSLEPSTTPLPQANVPSAATLPITAPQPAPLPAPQTSPNNPLSPKEAALPVAAVVAAAPAVAASMAAVSTARVRLAVLPWGEIEVDGKKMGISPPLTSLTLEPGAHVVVLRNADFKPRTIQLNVQAGQTLRVNHKFE